MYPFVRDLSYAVRLIFCFITIEQYPIFANETLQWIFWESLGLYGILLVVCYGITGDNAYKFKIKSPTLRSLIYFAVYMVLVFIMYGILRLLTKLNILPI